MTSDEIDLVRAIHDVDYRRVVIELLNKRPEDPPGPARQAVPSDPNTSAEKN